MTLSTLENKMDPTKTLLGRMLLEEITPLVMVLCTPSVEESCQKNGLTFLQMLLPFCFFNKIDVPVRTASDQPYRLQMFKLRLAYASDICQQNIEVAKENMKRVVSGASDQALLDLQSDSEPFESIHKTLESKSLPAWFQIFNKELIRTLSFSEHETFDHPVACLLVVSSKDVQPINKFVDLFNTDQLPSLLSDGAMDPKLLKYYLLLHDNQDGPMEKASNILADMRGTFGSSDCRLLCINSGEGTDRESDGNPWSSYINYSFEGQSIGCFIDVNDINEIKDLMQDFSSKHIIPYMEQKIRMLNQQVSATRKGLRNQIKNLWWRKGKEDITDDPHGPMYTFSSPEFQIRVLGDYAFMLRDYELALSNYRLLSTDYKLDKAWKQYAGVQEMAGLSYFMLDQSRKDAEYCMETAFNTYMRNGYSGHRNATRCGLWWAEMLKSWGHYREAAGIYFRISIEEATLHAAVMLEQSSYCYLNCDPPMLRKYGYHLVLAGNRYEFSDQRKHALRTYKNALSVYKGGVWKYINDHVNYKIGRWYSLHGLFDVSIRHLLEILACSHQPSHTQELFLKDFYHVVQNLGKTFKVYQLQLPIINMQSLNVIFEDHRTYASPSSVCIKESVWQCLEEELVPSTSTVRTNWLDSHSKPSAFKKYKDSAICVFGEAITVELEFKNPLQTAISVSAISLLCELSASSDVAISDDCESEAANESSELFEEKMEQDVDNSSYSLSKVELTLQGGEIKVVQLKVIPTEEGFFKIVGVRWTLSGLVIGYHKFDSDPPKRKLVNKKAAQGPSKPTLKFVVIKEFPKLDGCICKLPRKAYVGDFRRLSLELTNGSEYCIKNLKMMISHPKCIIPGKVKDMDMEFPACLEKQMDSETDVEQISVSYKPNGSLVLFPKDTTIQSGAAFLWPLWFHAGISGNMSLYISIYYEVENCSSEMKHRTLRMHYEIEVLPSLDVSIQITPYQSGLQEFLVRMDINNMTSSDNFSLRQLSTIQNQWTISSLLPDASICPSNVVLADQALSCFFKLQDSGEISVMEDSSPSLRRLKGSDIMLDPQRSREPLNISRSPFIDFFKQGGLQQNAQMESPNMIDLILISAPEENCGSFDPRGLLDMSQLFSHHLCLSRIMNTCPIWWIVDGPQVLYHDFFSSFCEISLRMTIHNCTNSSAKIKISTSDHMWPGDLSGTQANELSSEGRKSVVGWHDISITNDVEVSSDSKGPEGSADTGISPFVWSGSSSTWVTVDPLATAEIPLQICVFSPGTYNISNYTLHWSLQLSDDQVSTGGDAVRQSSGINRGHPFYLSVLQSA